MVSPGVGNYSVAGFVIINATGQEINVCFKQQKLVHGTFWQSTSTLSRSLPILTIHLILYVFICNIFRLILKPLRQPPLVYHILTGIVLGPTLVGHVGNLGKFLFPFEGDRLLETIGNLGITYYMFLVGIEMDLSSLRHIGKKSLSIGIAGVLVPLAIGAASYAYLLDGTKARNISGGIFWSITLTVTSFPDLARILSDVKLLHTDLGKTALTSSVVSEIGTWALLVGAITLTNWDSFFMLLPITAFVLLSWFLMRPILAWVIRRSIAKNASSGQGKLSDTLIYFLLAGVSACGLITDALGSHSIIGGFMFGLIIPKGELGIRMMDKLEEFVSRIMVPCFFLITGLRFNGILLMSETNVSMVIGAVVMTFSAKIISAFIVSILFPMSPLESFALGILTNAKGVSALIILNAGRDLKGMVNLPFTLLIISVLAMTSLILPLMAAVYKSSNRFKTHKPKSIQKSNPDSEFRMIACIHSTRNLSAITNILQLSNPNKRSPIFVFGVHMVELTGRTTAMLVVQDKGKSAGAPTLSNDATSEMVESHQIVQALESFSCETQDASIEPMTVVSPYATMHEDICNLAQDKGVTLILTPFHKHLTLDGTLQDDILSFREVNKNLLAKAPCSVAVFVDCGLGSSMQSEESCRLVMLFIGGSDDREALAYAWRMAGYPGVTLTVVRFLPGKEAMATMQEGHLEDDHVTDVLAATTESDREKQLDDEYINEFRFRSMCDQNIMYVERLVNNGDETVGAIRTSYNDFHLYVVGRGRAVNSPLTSGLSEWSECPELGAIGDILVSSEFAPRTSVLVVQQSAPAATRAGFRAASGSNRRGKFGHTNWRSPLGNPDFEALVHQNRKDHNNLHH